MSGIKFINLEMPECAPSPYGAPLWFVKSSFWYGPKPLYLNVSDNRRLDVDISGCLFTSLEEAMNAAKNYYDYSGEAHPLWLDEHFKTGQKSSSVKLVQSQVMDF